MRILSKKIFKNPTKMAISISTSDNTFLYINTAHVSALVS